MTLLVVFLVSSVLWSLVFFFFKQKTAYEMRISDWSSDVCSSDLTDRVGACRDLSAVCCPGFPRRGSGRVGYFSAFRIFPESVTKPKHFFTFQKIGRASSRERVCQYV